MKIILKISFTIALIFSILFCYSQEVNQNGYNIFYYTAGTKASEGTLKDGKPEGYWKTYHPDGKLKSEGNRKNFMLDSVWIFYNQKGDTSEVINYLNNKKSGYYYKYISLDTNGVHKNIVKSKELYLNDIQQGKSFYYYKSAKLYQEINFKEGAMHGLAKEYSEDGLLIETYDYRYNSIVNREVMNRYDKEGKKHGVWKEFYANGNLKSEAIYEHGVLNGYYKEFDETNLMTKMERYEKGVLIVDNKVDGQENVPKVEVKTELFDDGKIKKSGGFINNLPVGVHREFSEDGKVVSSQSYNDFGVKLSEGIIDSIGLKQGAWKYLYETGETLSEGNYIKDVKNGEWKYYFKNGTITQKGIYANGKPQGTWTWYFENGSILQQENYTKGTLDGMFTEFSEKGDTIVNGMYYGGERDGDWFFKIGDQYWTGKYSFGLEDGLWNYYYYPEMKLKSICRYVQGQQHDTFKYYYLNGRIKEEGNYVMGKKQNDWKYYDENGILLMTVTYNMDEMTKIDGLIIE